MNLTKGKISKLYKKNKQSVRRRKNGKGKTGRNRTFRKTKGLNLANKSLKNFYKKRGGDTNEVSAPDVNLNQGPQENAIAPAVNQDIAPQENAIAPAAAGINPDVVGAIPEENAIAPAVNQDIAPPAPEVNQDIAGQENAVPPEVNQDIVPQENAIAPEVNQDVAPEVNQDVADAVPQVNEVNEVAPVQENAIAPPVEVNEVNPVAPAEIPQENAIAPVDGINQDIAPQETAITPINIPQENVTAPAVDPNIIKLGNAVKTILDYTSSVIQNQGQNNTDGFQAVANNAAELATTGGKSNKFRLTRNKQSRRSNNKTRGKK